MQLIVYYAAASATYLVELPDQEKATVQDVLTLLLSQQFQHGVPLPAADCDAGSSSAHSLSLRFGGKVLDKASTLQENGITHLTTLHLVASGDAPPQERPDMVSQEELSRAVVVTGIRAAPQDMTDTAIYDAFAPFGLIERVIVQSDEVGNQHAVLIFDTDEAAISAATFDGRLLLGRRVRVMDAGSLPTAETSDTEEPVGSASAGGDMNGVAGGGGGCAAAGAGARSAGAGAGAGSVAGAGAGMPEPLRGDTADNAAGDGVVDEPCTLVDEVAMGMPRVDSFEAAADAQHGAVVRVRTAQPHLSPAGRALARFIAQGYIMGEQGVARVFRMEDRQRLSSYFSVAAETAHEKMTELDARFGILDKTAAMMDFAAKAISQRPGLYAGVSAMSSWIRRAQLEAFATYQAAVHSVERHRSRSRTGSRSHHSATSSPPAAGESTLASPASASASASASPPEVRSVATDSSDGPTPPVGAGAGAGAGGGVHHAGLTVEAGDGSARGGGGGGAGVVGTGRRSGDGRGRYGAATATGGGDVGGDAAAGSDGSGTGVDGSPAHGTPSTAPETTTTSGGGGGMISFPFRGGS